LVSVLFEAATRQPSAPAVRCGSRSWSYAELERDSSHLSRYFAQAGLKSGERVAALAKNCGELVVTFFACIKGGLIYTPLNFRYSAKEIVEVLSDCRASAVVASGEYMPMLESVRPALPLLRVLIGIDYGIGPWTGFAEAVSVTDADSPVAPEHNDLATLLYTSGTTGRPKGVMLGHKGLMHLASHAVRNWSKWGADDINLITVPQFHVGGVVMLLVGMLAGGLTILHAGFDPTSVLRALNQDRITRMFLVPSMIHALLQTPECESTDFSSLRLLMYAASPMPRDVLQRAIDVMRCPMAHVYGMTETSGAITFLGPEQHKGSLARRESCGRPLPGTQLRIVDSDGHDLPPGTVGQILIRTCQIMRGYFEQPSATTAALKDGWFYSGDVGELDGEGYLYVRDRIKDMIISGGENVYSTEVESVLLKHPAIVDAAVVGLPDGRFGEAVTAFVVARSSSELNEEAVRTHVRGHLAGYKVPRRVFFTAVLQRNAAGKVLKEELRKTGALLGSA
ncbi:MAG: long-chain-fatty-acid--CoA ligase, partial [Steroidobacteraceae bacterium]